MLPIKISKKSQIFVFEDEIEEQDFSTNENQYTIKVKDLAVDIDKLSSLGLVAHYAVMYQASKADPYTRQYATDGACIDFLTTYLTDFKQEFRYSQKVVLTKETLLAVNFN